MKKMKNQKINKQEPNCIFYRADDYSENMGTLIGFYESLEEAWDEIEHKELVTIENIFKRIPGDGNFSQITEFEVYVDDFGDIYNINDKQEFLKLWENAIIVNDHYYESN